MQMFTHKCDAVKGWLPGNMGCLDKGAKISPNVTVGTVFAGRVAHLNADGEFELGATGHQMPVFLRANSSDPDVARVSDDGSEMISPSGSISGYVATGAYELLTTEFDADQEYAYNDLLRAVASNSDQTIGGRLTNAGITLYTNAVCGVVSKPPFQGADRVDIMQLWPVYLPGSGA